MPHLRMTAAMGQFSCHCISQSYNFHCRWYIRYLCRYTKPLTWARALSNHGMLIGTFGICFPAESELTTVPRYATLASAVSEALPKKSPGVRWTAFCGSVCKRMAFAQPTLLSLLSIVTKEYSHTCSDEEVHLPGTDYGAQSDNENPNTKENHMVHPYGCHPTVGQTF